MTATTLTGARIAALAAAAGCDEAEVAAIVAEECGPYIKAGVQPPVGWLATVPVAQAARWLADKRWARAMTVHRHGMAIGEFVEDGRVVFVPAWANGSLDARSIATTPRFATLDEAKRAVDSWFVMDLLGRHLRQNQAAERAAAAPPPAPFPGARAFAAYPEYDASVCWECGGAIVNGDGVRDEPMGWAHRSCVGA